MCLEMTRIAGVFNHANALKVAISGFEALKTKTNTKDVNVRLKNAVCDESLRNCIATSGELKKSKDKNRLRLVADVELYNKEEGSSYDLLLHYLERRADIEGTEIEKSLDGVFAFALWRVEDDEVLIARDILGIKPLWFVHADGFAFASERKMLEAMGFPHAILLEPRTVLRYDIKGDRLKFEHRAFFSTKPELSGDMAKLRSELLELIRASVKRRIPAGEKFGVLFSGGLDSTLIAYLCKDSGADFNCYTVAVEEPGMKMAEDLQFAKHVAARHGFELRIKRLRIEELERYLKEVIPCIEDTDVVKASVALPLYVACEFAMEDGIKTILYGLGTEELFAGYERHKRVKLEEVGEECLSGLMGAYERDLYRDDVIANHCGISLRAPFLAPELVEFGLRIPPVLKLHNGEDKLILREIARRELGLMDVASRKKRAIQYGSNFIKAMDKLRARKGYRYKRDYIRTFYPARNINLGCIFNSGIESIYALWLMQKAGYQVDCLIASDSTSTSTSTSSSYMPEVVEQQAKALGLPLIMEPELERGNLGAVLREAKAKYQIGGIITDIRDDEAAKDRIERVAAEEGLAVLSPLWHTNYETELRLALSSFEVILCAVPVEHRAWLGKRITPYDSDIEWLVKHRGKYQTLVLNGPMFSGRIEIVAREEEVIGADTATVQLRLRLVEKEAETKTKTEICSGSSLRF